MTALQSFAPGLLPIYKRERERFVFLFITNECSLRCKHCFVGNKRLAGGEQMSLSKAVGVMDYFRAFGGHDKLYILGGEPTLNQNLPAIVRAARERDYAVTISSNGEFSDSVFDALPPDLVQSFNFSAEGPDAATHGKIRGRKDNFARVVDRIRTAVARGYQVRVMCTVTRSNFDRALEMIDFVADLGAHTLSFHNLGPTGNAVTMQKPLDPADWMRFCAAVETYTPRQEIAVYYPPTFISAQALQEYATRGYPGCPARSLDRIYVYPDGTVYSCPMLMDDERHFARFEDGRMRLQARADTEFDNLFNVAQICLGCEHNQTCGSGCPAWDALPAHQGGRVTCDRKTVPICILWTTYAWRDEPANKIHALR